MLKKIITTHTAKSRFLSTLSNAYFFYETLSFTNRDKTGDR